MDQRQFWYTRHARRKLRLYVEITREAVEHAVMNPERITLDTQGHSNSWVRFRLPRLKGEWLRVTFVEEPGRIVIITVTPRRRGPERV